MAAEKLGENSSYLLESMECQKRVARLQDYIPFLRKMIERLEEAKDGSKELQLHKMRSLLSVLTDSTKSLKLETIQRCEEVLSRMEGSYEWGGSPVALQDMDQFNVEKDTKNYYHSPYPSVMKSSNSLANETDFSDVAQRKVRGTAMDFCDESPRSPSPPSFINQTAGLADSIMLPTDRKDSGFSNLPLETNRELLNKPVVIPLERRDETATPIILPLERKVQSNLLQPVLKLQENKDEFEAKWYAGETCREDSRLLESNCRVPSDSEVVSLNSNVHQTFISSETLTHENVPRSDVPRLEEIHLNGSPHKKTGKSTDSPFVRGNSSWNQDEYFQRRSPKDKLDSVFENRSSSESTRSTESPHYVVPTTYDYGHGKNYSCPGALENNKESWIESENDGLRMQSPSGHFQYGSLHEKLSLEINTFRHVGVSRDGDLYGSDANEYLEENTTLSSSSKRRMSGSFNYSETNFRLQKLSIDKNPISFQSSKGYDSKEIEQKRSNSFFPPLFSSSGAGSKTERTEVSEGIENKKEGTVFEDFSYKTRKSTSEQRSMPNKVQDESSEDDNRSEKTSFCRDDLGSGSKISLLDSLKIPNPPEPPKFTSPPSSSPSEHSDHNLVPILAEKMSVSCDDSDSGSKIPFTDSINISHTLVPPKFTSPSGSSSSKHSDDILAHSHNEKISLCGDVSHSESRISFDLPHPPFPPKFTSPSNSPPNKHSGDILASSQTEKISACGDNSENGSKISFRCSVDVPESSDFQPSSLPNEHYNRRLAPSHSVVPQPASNGGAILKSFQNSSKLNISSKPIMKQSDLVQQGSWPSHMVDDLMRDDQVFQESIAQSHINYSNYSGQFFQHNIRQLNMNSPYQVPLLESTQGMQPQYMGMDVHSSQSRMGFYQMHRSDRPQKAPLLPSPVPAFMPNQISGSRHAWPLSTNYGSVLYPYPRAPIKNHGKGLLPIPQYHTHWQNDSRTSSIPSVNEKWYTNPVQNDPRSGNISESLNRTRPEYSKVINDPRLRRYEDTKPDQPEEKCQWKHPADPRRASPLATENRLFQTERKQPVASISKEKEVVSSQFNSLYGTEQAPKTGKEYGIQKFPVANMKRDEPEKVPFKNVMGPMSPLREPSESTEAEEKPKDEENKEEENAKPKRVTKDLFEILLKMTLSSEEGTRILENSKFITELREKLKLVRPKRTRPIIESDSESSEEEEVKPTGRGNKKFGQIIDSPDSDSSEEKEVGKDVTSEQKTPIVGTPLRQTGTSSQINETSNVDSSSELPDTPSQHKLFNEEDEVKMTNVSKKYDEDVQDKDEAVDKEIESKVFMKEEKQKEVENEELKEESKQKIPAKKKKRRSPLELLQEDIREMFICDGVLSANGHRMCRLLKEAASESDMNEHSAIENDESQDLEEFIDNLSSSSKHEDICDQSEELTEEKTVKTSFKTGRRKCGNQTLKTKMHQGKSGSKIDSIKEEYKESESQVVYKDKSKEGNETVTSASGSSEHVDSENLIDLKTSVSTVTEDKSVSFENESENPDENDSSKEKGEEMNDFESEKLVSEGDEVLEGADNKNGDLCEEKNEDNVEKCTKRSKFKKKLRVNKRWALGIIKRSVKHNMKSSTSVSPCLSEGESNVSVNPAEFLSNAELTDIDYFSSGNNTVRCKLCSFQGKQIVGHYITKHPESEVLVSRLSKDQVMVALEMAEANKGAPKNLKAAVTSTEPFVCLICESWHNVYAEFYDHVTTHTGEYRYKCKMCSYHSFRLSNVRSHLYFSHQVKWCDSLEYCITKPFEMDEIEDAQEQETDENSSTVIPGLVAHLCSKCNYVQISGKKLMDHVEKYHKGEENAKILKIDMSVLTPESSVDHDVPKCLEEKSNVELDEESSRSSWSNSVFSEKDSTFSDVSKASTLTTGTEKSIKKDASVDDSEINLEYDEEVFIIEDESECDLIKDFVRVWYSLLSCPGFENEIERYQDEFKVKIEEEEEENRKIQSTVMDDIKEIFKKGEEKELSKIPAKDEDSKKVAVQNQDELGNFVIPESGKNVVGGEKSETVDEVIKIADEEKSETADEVMKVADGESTNELDDAEDDDSSYCECTACLDYISDDEVICDLIIEKPEKNKLFSLDILPTLQFQTSVVDMINKVNTNIVNKFKLDDSYVKKFEEEYDAKEKLAYEEKLVSEMKRSQKIRVRSLSGDMLSSDSESKDLPSDHFFSSNQQDSEAVCNPEDGQDPSVVVTGNSPVFEPDADNGLCQISGVYSLHPNQQVPGDLINAISDDVGQDMSNLAPNSPGPCSTPCPPPLYLFPPVKLVPSQAVENVGFANERVSVIKKTPTAIVSDIPNSQVDLNVISSLYPNAYSGESNTPGVIIEELSGSNTLGHQKKSKESEPIFPKPLIAAVLEDNGVNTSNTDATVLNSVIQIAPASTNIQSRKDPSKDSVVGNSKKSSKTKVCSRMRTSVYGKTSKTLSIFNQVINDPMKLCHIFKCMDRKCSFTTDEADVFLLHFLTHEYLVQNSSAGTSIVDKNKEKQEGRYAWRQCSYCVKTFLTGRGYLKHVQSKHGECIYQCAYCFYRAAAASYVMIHQKAAHVAQEVKVFHCKQPGKSKDSNNEASEVKPKVEPYVCCHGNCMKEFYCPDKYLLHLQTAHKALFQYSCHKCNFQCFKPYYLIQHYSLHSFYLYQCIYCEQGADTSEEILRHLAVFHQNKKAAVCKRSSQGGSEGSSNTTGRHAFILYENIELNEKDNVESVSKESLDSKVVPEKLGKESELKDLQKGRKSVIVKEGESGDCNDNDNLVIAEDAFDINSTSNKLRIQEESDIIDISPDSSDESEVAEETVAEEEPQKLNHVEKDDRLAEESVIKHSENSNTSEAAVKELGYTARISDLNDSGSLSKSGVVEDSMKNNGDYEKRKNSGDNEDNIIEIRDDKEASDSYTETCAATDSSILGLKSESQLTQNELNDLAEEKKCHKIDAIEIGDDKEASDSYTETCAATDSSILGLKSESQLTQNELNDLAEEKKCHKIDANVKVDPANLYLCCSPVCTFLAKDISHLKLHLKVCSFAKDDKRFTCPHCGRNFKSLPFLLKHYRVHRKKRFVCMVCDYEGPNANKAVQHVKSRHHATSATVIPLTDWLEPDDSEVAKDHKLVVVAPKEISLSFLLRKRFLPEDADHLPFPSVYSRDAKCSLCSYSTKIRSNLRRHLHFHLRFKKQGIVLDNALDPNQVPWSATDIVNPIPILEKKEVVCDEMSSHLTDKVKEEEKKDGGKDSSAFVSEEDDFTPRFVPENERFVCGMPGCLFKAVDGSILRHHMRAHHSEETTFRCLHCPFGQGFIEVPVDRLAVHLKMHDDCLYQCTHCTYYHFQRRFVERHLKKKHFDPSQMVNIIREPDTIAKISETTRTSGKAGTSSDVSARSNASNDAALDEANLWHCSRCSFSCTHGEEMSEHIKEIHSLSSQYICGRCPFCSGHLTAFHPHFSCKHPGYPVQLIANYFQSNISEFAPPTIIIILPNGKVIHPMGLQSSNPEDLRNKPVIEVWPYIESGFGRSSSSAMRLKEQNTTYPWHRCMPKIRFIRGIPIADEGEEIFYCFFDSLNPKHEGKNSPKGEVSDVDPAEDRKECIGEEKSSKTKCDSGDVELKTVNKEIDIDSSVVEKCIGYDSEKVEREKSVETMIESHVKRNLEESENPSPVKRSKLEYPSETSSSESEKEESTESLKAWPFMKIKVPPSLNFDHEGKYFKEECLKKQFGEYGDPEDDQFVCPKCEKYKTKCMGEMREHLFKELNYLRFVCTHCGMMSPEKARLQKHSIRMHQKDGKPEAIAALPSDSDIEFWVQHSLNFQLQIMKEGKPLGSSDEMECDLEGVSTPDETFGEGNEIQSIWKNVIVSDGVIITDENLLKKRRDPSPMSSEPKKHCPLARESMMQDCDCTSMGKHTARKSTCSKSCTRNLQSMHSSTNEGFSWYNGGKGAVKESLDLSRITVWTSFGGYATKKVPVSKMAELIDLSPQLCIKDINRYP